MTWNCFTQAVFSLWYPVDDRSQSLAFAQKAVKGDVISQSAHCFVISAMLNVVIRVVDFGTIGWCLDDSAFAPRRW